MTFEPPKSKQSQPVSSTQHFDGADPSSTTATPTSASTVRTTWNLDYTNVAGTHDKIPQRTSEDELVAELKVAPNHGMPKMLRGVNLAKSGGVGLGTVEVPKGDGYVSAALDFAKRKDFVIQVDVYPAASSRDASEVAVAKQKIAAVVWSELQSRGDYEAIAAEVTKTFKSWIPDKEIAVSLKPTAKPSTKSLSADKVKYSASKDTAFGVTVNLGEKVDHSDTSTVTGNSEHGKSKTHSKGVSLDTSVDQQHQVDESTKYAQEKLGKMSETIQEMFRHIKTDMEGADSDTRKEWSNEVTWTAGVGEKNEKNEKTPPDGKSQDDDKPGVAQRIFEGVRSGLGWFVSKAASAAKRIPLLSSALSFAGDLWGTVSGRASISRASTTSNKTSDGAKQTQSATSSAERSDFDTLATEFTRSFKKETESKISDLVKTHVGTLIKNEDLDADSDKRAKTVSTTTTHLSHELGKPTLEVTELE